MKDFFELYVKQKWVVYIKYSFHNVSLHVNQSEQVTTDVDDRNERGLGILNENRTIVILRFLKN